MRPLSMTPERWRQVKEIFHAALEIEPAQRGAFLEQACAGQDSLRREVESLLRAQDEANSFLEQPAVASHNAAAMLLNDEPKLSAGRRLGHYEIIKLAGAGGMGEVYLAQDSILGRQVALKFLPSYFTKDAARLRRFEQEARAASALNHPNIITIYEIGEADGRRFIATEFIEGETLRQRMGGGPLKTVEALNIAEQAASALAAAHAAGIIHRDIKPENIMLRRDGIAKVLDFGLAKLAEKKETGPEDATRAMVQTSAGVVMGTVTYMSPEQARGLAVDARTDVWSLGVVLYEMVAGRLPFAGETASDVISLILQQEPSALTAVSASIPERLDEIVTKALTKNREERYQTVKDLALDLKQLKQKLDIKAEIERTASAEKFGVPPSGGWLAGTPTSPPEGGTPNTRASSAEYVVSGIKQHKLAAVVAVILLVLGVVGLSAYLHARNTEVAIDSIAVLPFENQNHDADSDYLSDGLTESIINSLTQLPNLKVIPRNVAFRYKGKSADSQKAGDELRVSAVLTGRVVQRGDNVTVSVELDDIRYGKQLWGERYDRKLADLLAVQNEIASEISQRLRAQLTGEERQKLAKGSTANPDAYQLYLKGSYYTSKYSKEGLGKGIDYFNKEIALEPNYALAYNGLAYAHINSVGWYMSAHESMPKARDAAKKALAIDETLPDAHLSLALVAHWYDWDWATAEREFQRAIELNPKDPRAHGFYSWYLVTQGRVDQAIEEGRRSVRLDPVSPEAYAFLGFTLFYARQYDQAIEQLRNGIELDSTFWLDHDYLGRAYEASGKLPEAITEFQRALQLEDGNGENWSNLAHAYALSGKRGEAQKILDHLKELSAHSYVDPYFMAVIYAGLGDKDQAFAWLQRAYADRSFGPAFYLKVDPQMDSLRSDPRFADLLRRVGLPQ